MRGYRKDEFFRKESNGICAGWYCSSRDAGVTGLCRYSKNSKNSKNDKVCEV